MADKLPPPEVMQRALQAACFAPNHKMTEPWRFRTLGPETVKKTLDVCIAAGLVKEGKRGKWTAVPGWLVVTQVLQADDDQLRRDEDYAAVCCSIHNLTLSLWGEGVGTKWTTGDYTRSEEFADVIGVDLAQERVVGVVWYGYADYGDAGLDGIPDRPRKLSVQDIHTVLP